MASAAARVAAIEAALPPLQRSRIARARASARGPERRAPGPAARRPGAAGLSAARQGAAARRARHAADSAGPTSAPPSAGWRPRPRREGHRRAPTSIRGSRVSGFLGLLAGRGNLFGSADSRAWAVTPALQLGRLRSRQRPGPAPRRRGGDARSRWPTTSRPCCWRSRRPRTRWSATASSRSAWSSWPTRRARAPARPAIARVRYREGRRRLPVAARRRAHPAAGRGRRRAGRGRRLHQCGGDLTRRWAVRGSRGGWLGGWVAGR